MILHQGSYSYDSLGQIRILSYFSLEIAMQCICRICIEIGHKVCHSTQYSIKTSPHITLAQNKLLIFHPMFERKVYFH